MKRKRNISVVCQRKIAKININLVEFVLVFVWQQVLILFATIGSGCLKPV
ncbi:MULTISPECIES: hypothetical protein [unclassified Snodgrassella]|nr:MULTISPECIES: hypothetical protein [Snodgrassella]MBI0068494.1 hypothetical protein [Snodgrassella sp. M0110]MBI0077504.1 hypothetical protein [Snodgrassella sp. M0118]MBI0079943.1 hypothetical protein [Snodgrassella sp. M0112]MBI0133986.1 hypothetical protein [Snodgrassella sp. W8132]MCT6883189.1 hypothetical protein [Snodgrassella alvi]